MEDQGEGWPLAMEHWLRTGGHSLYQMCEWGELEGVRAALVRGEDINQRGGARGWTGLMAAVFSSQAPTVHLLVDHAGLDVNLPDSSGRTALHLACYETFGDAGLVRLLLAHPSLACLNSRDSWGASPIMAAVSSGNMDCFRELARLPGVNLETRNEQGLGLEEVAWQVGWQEEVRREMNTQRWRRSQEWQLPSTGGMVLLQAIEHGSSRNIHSGDWHPQEIQVAEGDEDNTIEETTHDEDIDDGSIEEINDDDYEEQEETSMFRGEYEISDDEDEVEIQNLATNIAPEATTTQTNNQWNSFLEKYSKQKLLSQKRQKQLEAKEKMVDRGNELKANVDRIQEKYNEEKRVLDTLTKSYWSSYKATQREILNFKDQEEICIEIDIVSTLQHTIDTLETIQHKEILRRRELFRMLTEAKIKEQTKRVKQIQNEITSESLKLENLMAVHLYKDPREELECPVCCEDLGAPRRIYQCSQGHPVCSSCRPRLRNCPTCRASFMGRAIGMEQLVQAVRDREGV